MGSRDQRGGVPLLIFRLDLRQRLLDHGELAEERFTLERVLERCRLVAKVLGDVGFRSQECPLLTEDLACLMNLVEPLLRKHGLQLRGALDGILDRRV